MLLLVPAALAQEADRTCDCDELADVFMDYTRMLDNMKKLMDGIQAKLVSEGVLSPREFTERPSSITPIKGQSEMGTCELLNARIEASRQYMRNFEKYLYGLSMLLTEKGYKGLDTSDEERLVWSEDQSCAALQRKLDMLADKAQVVASRYQKILDAIEAEGISTSELNDRKRQTAQAWTDVNRGLRELGQSEQVGDRQEREDRPRVEIETINGESVESRPSAGRAFEVGDYEGGKVPLALIGGILGVLVIFGAVAMQLYRKR